MPEKNESNWADLLDPRYNVPDELTDMPKNNLKAWNRRRKAIKGYKRESSRDAVSQQKAWLNEKARSSEGIDPRAILLFFVIIAALVAGVVGFNAFTGQQQAASATVATPTATGAGQPSQAATEDPAIGSTGPAAPATLGTGPQAVTNPKAVLPTHDPSSWLPIVAEAPKDVDRENVDSVINAWAKAYLTHESATDKEWTSWVKDYVDAGLLSQETSDKGIWGPGQALDKKAPAIVISTQVKRSEQAGMADTPVRATRTVTTQVQSAADRTRIEIEWTVTGYRGEAGWSIVDAVPQSWTLR